ncbi:MAG: type 4a pilus biogenesis protein PilO [Trueperaceae bacterium]|nr:MAG: type 4a pilus biogenesis protein PilO [Trueperaceae bacterium]
MNLGNFNLRDLRQRDIAIICIVITVAIALAWFFYMYRPTLEKIDLLETEIAQLDVQIEDGERARRNLPDLRLTVAQLEEERREFLLQLPRESEVSNLMDQLRVSATNSEVIFERLSQESRRPGEIIDGVRPIGFKFTTTGTYSNTANFLTKLESLQRFTKIQEVNFSVTNEESDDPELSTNFDFLVYVFTGEDPGEL